MYLVQLLTVVSMLCCIQLSHANATTTASTTTAPKAIEIEEKKILLEMTALQRDTEQLYKAIANVFVRKELLHLVGQRRLTASSKRSYRVEKALQCADGGDISFLQDIIFDNIKEAKNQLQPLLRLHNAEAARLWQEFSKLANSVLVP